MSSRKDDLLSKYFAAESTIKEEEELFSQGNETAGIEEWSRFVQNKKVKAPSDLKASIWSKIQAKKRRKQRFMMGMSGIAASITILLVLFFNGVEDNGMPYEEKEAMLKEALSMFGDEPNEKNKQTIIYEDEMIVIYIASN